MQREGQPKTVFASVVFWFSLFFFLALDQISKETASRVGNMQVFSGLAIEPTNNYAGAFSAYNLPHPALFLFIPLILFVPFFFFYHKNMSKKMMIAAAVFVAGILGNGLDRIFRGSVLDWIEVSSEYVLNLADLFIFIGLVVIFVCTVSSYRAESQSLQNTRDL